MHEQLAYCPLCGENNRKLALGDWSDDLAIMQCDACLAHYASARYEEEMLDERYYAQRASAPNAYERDRKRRALELYDRLLEGRLLSPCPGARVLDIGCGNGAMLDELARAGYITEGIERVPSLAAIASDRHTLHTLDPCDPAATLAHRYDVITMCHVFEHMTRPVAALRFVCRHLAQGGVVIIEVPNWTDPARALWGRFYRPLELGDHVVFYDRTTMHHTLEEAGLQICALWSRPQGASLVLPSVLSGLDLGRSLVRRWAKKIKTPPGVLGPRVGGRSSSERLRLLTLRALDRLDPWIERLTPPSSSWGANLIAIGGRPHDDLH